MLKCVGIYLPSPVSSHGQLCVAFSQSSSFDNIAVAIAEEHRQHIESDELIKQIFYTKKSFKISNI
jgi:hypothetical protein